MGPIPRISGYIISVYHDGEAVSLQWVFRSVYYQSATQQIAFYRMIYATGVGLFQALAIYNQSDASDDP